MSDNSTHNNKRISPSISKGQPEPLSPINLNISIPKPKRSKINRGLIFNNPSSSSNSSGSKEVVSIGLLNRSSSSSSSAGDSKVNEEESSMFLNKIKEQEGATVQITKSAGTSGRTFIVGDFIVRFFEIPEYKYLQRVLGLMGNIHPRIVKSVKISNDYIYVKMNKFGMGANIKLQNLKSGRNHLEWIDLRQTINDAVSDVITNLHSKNLIHGDLVTSKGSINDANILINEDGEIKFIDFGLHDSNYNFEEIKEREGQGIINIDLKYSKIIKSAMRRAGIRDNRDDQDDLLDLL